MNLGGNGLGIIRLPHPATSPTRLCLLNPEVMERALNQAREQSDETEYEVTEREMEVLRAVGQGLTSKQIALQLGITERTVKAHLTNIYNKLGVDSRAAAIAEAAKRGWLEK